MLFRASHRDMYIDYIKLHYDHNIIILRSRQTHHNRLVLYGILHYTCNIKCITIINHIACDDTSDRASDGCTLSVRVYTR